MNSKIQKIELTYPTEENYIASAGNLYRTIATGTQTKERFSLLLSILEPGQGGPLHTHTFEQESFYILKGRLTVFDAEQRFSAPSGTFVFCPEGAKRGFRNETKERVEMLIFYTPAGIEKMIEMDGTPVQCLENYLSQSDSTELACPALNQQFGIEEL
ncbi:cupin domain-containing protein [Pseudoalteromonas luteoviolacea]|uniref:cupin domain-containing protein n=1 Tax=Pseudoalteromonas luteoviolacea TaxID=43657 RepID=UPI00163CC56F|nr:cupin domain-containing protein [Pseudoalteromonas luteoviolacea]